MADFRAAFEPLVLPDDSDVSITVQVRDSVGAGVDLSAKTFSLDIMDGGVVALAATMDHTGAASGDIGAAFENTDLAALDDRSLSWRLRSVTDEVSWVVGPCVVDGSGAPASTAQTIPVTQAAGTFEVTLGAFAVAAGSGSGSTNLAATTDASTVTVTSDTGTDATLPAATTSDAGVMSAADFATLGAAFQPGDPLRVMTAPGNTVTTVGATDGALDVDVIVAEGPSATERADITLPPLSDWPGQRLAIVGRDFGPSIGYPTGATATWHEITGLASTNTTDADSDVTAPGVTLEFDTFTGPSMVAQWALDPVITATNITAVAVENFVWTGSPADVVIGYAVTDLAGTLLIGDGSDVEVNGTGLTSGTNSLVGLSSPQPAAGAYLTVFVSPIGGAPVAPTTVAIDGLWVADDVGDVYVGYDNGTQGVGELPTINPFGPYTHGWNDSDSNPFKVCEFFNDGTLLHLISTTPRWEFLFGFVPTIGGPLDPETNLFDALQVVNAELLTQSAADGITFDNATSGLTATDVQAALDQIEARLDAAGL